MAFWRHGIAGQVRGNGDRQRRQWKVLGSGHQGNFSLFVGD
jgi:hypothetical protein